MRYAVVLFDLDHTLLDTEHSFEISFDETMRSVGISTPASVRAAFDTINNSLWNEVEQGRLNPDDLHLIRFRRMFNELGIGADPGEAASCFASSQIASATLYPEARGLIERVCAKAKTAIVTNGISVIQRGVLRTLGLDDAFDAVVISGEEGVNKPAPEFFEATLSKLGVTDLASTVIVGDSLASDIQGGISAGIDTIWFNRHNLDPGNVTPTHTVASLNDVADLLRL